MFNAKSKSFSMSGNSILHVLQKLLVRSLPRDSNNRHFVTLLVPALTILAQTAIKSRKTLAFEVCSTNFHASRIILTGQRGT
jgi:hypothetical protein